MTNYKLSIIIPTFNVEQKVEKAFKSIKSQTMGFENIEVLFVDDNSTDNTVQILNGFVDEYKNVKLFNTDENSGFAGKPRNIGIDNANSDYVLFLDGDDELLIDACEVLYNRITSENADIVIGGQINVFDGILQHNPPLFNARENTFTNNLKDDMFNIAPAISAKLFRKETLIENGTRFPEGISGQDLVFFTKAILTSSKVVTLNDFYVYYRHLYKTSVTLNITEKYLYGLIKAYLQVCELFDEFEIETEIQEKVLIGHLKFFNMQILRSKRTNKLNDEQIKEVLNSDSFKELSNQSIFQNNDALKQYFKNMSEGNYNNHDLLNGIYEDTDFNSRLFNELTLMKNELEIIKTLENKKTEENMYLKKQNSAVMQELNEIKSTKLWKLMKIFKKERE